MSQPCRFFLKGHCKFSASECKFSHQAQVQQGQVQQVQVQQGQAKQHSSNEAQHRHQRPRRHPKNTECFNPSHLPADMRVLVANEGGLYQREVQSNDVILIPGLFCKEDDFHIYNDLLKEMDQTGIQKDKLWKLWHGDSHLIADDSLGFKSKCPLFTSLIDKIQSYFDMDVKATRFNYYRDDSDWKPYHHDAAATKADKAKTQNFTVGVSFGATREISFEDAQNTSKTLRRIISFPLPNGTIYAFGKDINIMWKHGVPQVPEVERTGQGRISLICWGKVNQKDISGIEKEIVYE
jgi:hypothetical protein